MIDVIYLAAGRGKRVGLGYPKQFARLGGKPILVHGLEVLQTMPEIRQIIIPFPPGLNDEEYHQFMNLFWSYINNSPTIIPIEGGETRQDSVRRALPYIETEYVLVTEAVRPFITAEFVRQVVNAPGDAVTPWRPATSTVINLDWICLDRERVGEVQMPQKFRTQLLRQAHTAAVVKGIKEATDDSFLVMNMTATPISVILGLEENIKITTPLDLVIAEAIYNARYLNEE